MGQNEGSGNVVHERGGGGECNGDCKHGGGSEGNIVMVVVSVVAEVSRMVAGQ